MFNRSINTHMTTEVPVDTRYVSLSSRYGSSGKGAGMLAVEISHIFFQSRLLFVMTRFQQFIILC